MVFLYFWFFFLVEVVRVVRVCFFRRFGNVWGLFGGIENSLFIYFFMMRIEI